MNDLIQIQTVVGNHGLERLIGLHKSGSIWNGEVVSDGPGRYKITWTEMNQTIKTQK
jgi:hypothetical protein